RGARLGRHPVAAHVVALPPPSPGRYQYRGGRARLRGRPPGRVPRLREPDGLRSAALAATAADGPLARPGAPRAPRVRIDRPPRSADLSAGLHARPGQEDLTALLRAGV